MKNSDILSLIDQKADNSIEVAQEIIENPQLLPIIFEGISSESNRIKFRSAKILRIISEKEPDILYPHIDFFIELLDTTNSIILWNVLDIIANLTAVDAERRFDKIFQKYYGFLEAGSMVTAAHVVDNSSKIATNRPDIRDEITDKLLKVDQVPLSDECHDILSGKAIIAFDDYFDSIKGKEEVLSFAEMKLQSQRNATRLKARKFLKKHNE